MNVLTGHDSPDTAYVVEDYPYGFRLRTQIRYWVETRSGYGQRFISQTMDPKRGRWNKPKAGTYSRLTVMFLDDIGHVQCAGIDGWANTERLDAFLEAYGEALEGNYEREAIRHMRAQHRVDAKITWVVEEAKPGVTYPTMKEVSKQYANLVRAELWNESKAARAGQEQS